MTNQENSETAQPVLPTIPLIAASELDEGDPRRPFVEAVHQGLRPVGGGIACLLRPDALPMSGVVGNDGAANAAALEVWLALVNPSADFCSEMAHRCTQGFGKRSAKATSRRKALVEFARALCDDAATSSVEELAAPDRRSGSLLSLTSSMDGAPGMSWITELHVVEVSSDWVALLHNGDWQDDPLEAFPSIIGFARADRWVRGVVELLLAVDWELGGGGEVNTDDSAVAEVINEAWIGGSAAVSWLLEQPDDVWARLFTLDGPFIGGAEGVMEELQQPPLPPEPPDFGPIVVNRCPLNRNPGKPVARLSAYYAEEWKGHAAMEGIRRWTLERDICTTFLRDGVNLPGMACRYELEAVTRAEAKAFGRAFQPDKCLVEAFAIRREPHTAKHELSVAGGLDGDD